MILMHVAYGLDLIALTMGTGLTVWSMKNPGKGSGLGKFFGVIVMVLAIISIVCIYACALSGGECHNKTQMMEEAGVTAPVVGEPAHEHVKKVEHKH